MSIPFDQIASMHTAFMSSGIFSESVTATRADGRQYPFTAVIKRVSPETVAGANKVKETFIPFFEFWIPASSFPSEPTKSGDKFSFPTIEGGQPSIHTLVSIVQQDATGWLVRCR